MIVSGVAPELIVIERLAVCDCTGEDESVTLTVKLEEPAAVGVPAIAPVDAFRLSPAGSVPDKMFQVYGVLPPVAARV